MNKGNNISPFEDFEQIFKAFGEQSFLTTEELFKNKKAYTNYPPSNIFLDKKNNNFIIELSVAGWNEDEINISVKNEVLLIIEGQKTIKNKNKDFEIIVASIAERNFKKEYHFKDEIEDLDISLNQGILSIKITPKEPKEETKQYKITNKNKKD